MERTILHSDINCCYAAIEHLHHPELAGKPLAVGGDPESRHGIVLTADYIAQKYGVKTGMALWQAKQVCPDITFISPRMDLYLRFSRMAHEIYSEYTDLQEPYGIDESWLDVSASSSIKGDGYKIAEEISNRMKSELGITVSIGVSFDKIYAKLGSDYKKPDAITTMYKDEFRQKAWKLPASDLLYVGRSTNQKLLKIGIKTIGDLARMDEHILVNHLGKMGSVLWAFANGYDESPVRLEDTHAPIKSVGNSTTTPRDLENDEDVKIVLYILAESVAARLRENGFRCRVVEISIRDNELFSFTRQKKIDHGGFELISGHRRTHAARRAGLDKIPVFIKDYSDDEAVCIMVDSNIQRERILPSEKAFALKMKMDAMKHQGFRSDLISDQNDLKSTLDHKGLKLTTDVIGKDYGMSSSQVKRYIRLTHLLPELLLLVDQEKIKVTNAVEISFLSVDVQKQVLDYSVKGFS